MKSFRPLSRGPFFNRLNGNVARAGKSLFSSPFSGTFFQCIHGYHQETLERMVFVPFLGDLFSIKINAILNIGMTVFVPFLGDLFSMMQWSTTGRPTMMSFRPLSRGPFFNGDSMKTTAEHMHEFSSPFSGTFFQSVYECHEWKTCVYVFVPFLGDLFSIFMMKIHSFMALMVFVPFLGDLFSIGIKNDESQKNVMFSSPFSGTFFQ